jgi:16S rRNA processing protein RimM
MDEAFLVAIGKVIKAHGVQGALKVLPYGDTLSGMEAGEKLFSIRNGEQRELTLASLQPQKRVWIARFEEIASREQAEALTGNEIFIGRDRLPGLAAGEYYHFQLIGLSVVTKEGRRLGILRAVLETGGNDVYVVENDGKELLVPAIEDVIDEVDLQSGKIIVDLPEGLE